MKRSSLLTAVASLVIAAACNDRDTASGIGRPSVPVDHGDAERLPLSLRRIYAPLGDAAQSFAVIANDSDVTIPSDLSRAPSAWFLCTGFGDGTEACVRLAPGELCTTATDANGRDVIAWQPLQRCLTPEGALASLALRPNAGDLAVVDDTGFVHAYLAWGADPTTLASPLHARAVLSEATKAGSFVELGFPMPEAGVAVSAEPGEAAGCSAIAAGSYADNAERGDVQATLCPDRPASVRIDELLPVLRDEGESWVELRNTAAEPVDLYGVRLCTPPACVLLPRGAVVDAGALAWIGLDGAAPSDEAAASEVWLPDAMLLPPAGEVALLAPGPASWGESLRVLSYVRYGDTAPTLLEAVDDPEAVWAGDSSAAAPRVPGESLSRDVNGADAPEGWAPAVATPLQDNVDIGEDAGGDLGVWTSCSQPRPWISPPASLLRISSISRGSEPNADDAAGASDGASGDADAGLPEIRLTHAPEAGAPMSSLESYELTLGGVTVALAPPTDAADAPATELPAVGSSLRVLLVSDSALDVCRESHVRCLDDPSLAIGASGWALLRRDGQIVRFIQWGAAETPAQPALEAVEAGVWPLERCRADGLEDTGATLTLEPGTTGRSPADFYRD